MDAALFSAHDVNTNRAAVEGEKQLADGSWLTFALSRREMGPMSFLNRPEWDVAHNRMQFLRLWDLKIDNLIAAGLDHTADVLIVGPDDRRRGAREFSTAPQQTDGLLTKAEDIVLMTTHADCLPVWLATPSGWIGLAHAGWRGLEAGIIRNLIEAVPETDRSDLEIAIGPGICPDHYEVGPEVAERFHADEIMAPAVQNRGESFFLDLSLAARLQGEAAGAAVDDSMFSCTYENDYLASFRRDGAEFTPMAAIITRSRS
jgi:YfiH family protein